MPITLIRVHFTEQAQKNVTLAQNRGVRGDRKKQLELLCKSAGCRFVDLYISLITNENVRIIEGSLEQIRRSKQFLGDQGPIAQ